MRETVTTSRTGKELPRSGGIRLAAALLAICLTWLVLLPWLSQQSTVARHIQRQAEQGIDPSAMFYSELEILPPIAHRAERTHERLGYRFDGR